jgi:hypothetical protein
MGAGRVGVKPAVQGLQARILRNIVAGLYMARGDTKMTVRI